jgi:hypothetical protein
VSRGSFHILSDGLKVGWHRRFRELIVVPLVSEEVAV